MKVIVPVKAAGAIFIVAFWNVAVNPVTVPKLQAVIFDPARLIVLVPRLIDRVVEPLLLNAPVNVSVGLLTLKSSVKPDMASAVSVPKDLPLRVASSVTVPVPELPSKVGLSPVVGADAPPDPPEVDAQCVVDDASQVPVPPTQNLVAI